jgi:hypothetical protein
MATYQETLLLKELSEAIGKQPVNLKKHGFVVNILISNKRSIGISKDILQRRYDRYDARS